MNNKPTLNIVLSALNEEANIGYLIDDLSKQTAKSYELKHIIICSDGSIDETNEVVKSKNNENVVLLDHKDTIGHPERQNEMLRMSETDVVIILNADIQIDDPEFVEKLAKPVINGEADLISCIMYEKEPVTFFEKVVYNSMEVKREIFDDINGGINVYTCHGPCRALSQRFYKTLEFTAGSGEDAYSYFSCIKNGFKYKYVTDTYIKYRLSNNFSDYKKQNMRFVKSKDLREEEFGKEFIKEQFGIPLDKAALAIVKNVVKHPVLSFCYVIVYSAGLLSYKLGKTPSSWELAKSSKLVRNNRE